MMGCLQLIFRHGVQHVVTALIVESHNQETTRGYRDQIVRWTRWAVAGPEALHDYTRLGWRARLLGGASWPELAALDAELTAATSHHAGPTVWFSVASRPALEWQQILRVAVAHQITDRQALVRAVYGEEIPPATLYLGAGKPQVVESIVPPLLVGKLECYWRQHLGYDLDERTFRMILYDFAYVRPTWRADKTGRAEQILAYQEAWHDPPVIGLGIHVGPFWYPAPIAATAQP
jgi:hypothetical protein